MPTPTVRRVLDRLLAPLERVLTPQVARELVRLEVPPDIQERLDYLAKQANEGRLTDAERAEYGSSIQGLHLMAVLQAKAQLVLSGTATPAEQQEAWERIQQLQQKIGQRLAEQGITEDDVIRAVLEDD